MLTGNDCRYWRKKNTKWGSQKSFAFRWNIKGHMYGQSHIEKKKNKNRWHKNKEDADYFVLQS